MKAGDTSAQRALFIARHIPDRAGGGSQQRAFHLLRAVASVSEVSLVCPSPGAKMSPELDSLGAYCRRVLPFPEEAFGWVRDAAGRPVHRRLKSLANVLIPGRTDFRSQFRNAPGTALVRSAVREQPYDLIWAERLSSLWMLPPGTRTRVVVDLDDLEHRRMESRLRSGDIRRARLMWRLEARKLRRIERDLTQGSYEVLVCSDLDRLLLGGGPSVHVVPNGADIPPERGTCEGKSCEPVLLFVGSMCFPPNVDAVVHFADYVLPRIRQRIPQARLVVVGKGPNSEVLRLHDGKTVEVVGAVPDVSPYLRRAAVSIAPIRFGAGTRIKILEAMAHGVPVVSTAMGAEGLEVEPGNHLLVANDPDSFAGECVRLLLDAGLRLRISAKAFDRVSALYSWARIERLAAELAAAPAANPTPRPGHSAHETGPHGHLRLALSSRASRERTRSEELP